MDRKTYRACQRCGVVEWLSKNCMACVNVQRAMRENVWGYWGEDEGKVPPVDKGEPAPLPGCVSLSQKPKLSRMKRLLADGEQYTEGCDIPGMVDRILAC